MERRVLVTGGAGYIGAHAAKALARRGITPVVFDNLMNGHAASVKWGPLVKGDLRDRAAILAALEEHRPEAVMHFAACAEVGIGERDPEKFYDHNVMGSLNLVSAMRDAGVGALVFSSTCATYGAPARLPITEDAPQAPVNVYGRTKLAVERMIADFSRAYGLSAAMLRYFNAAGADAEAEIGEEHEPETHLIPNALRAVAGVGAPLDVFGDDYDTPDGSCVRDYIHVEDLADAHLLALDHIGGRAGVTALNLGAGRGVSVLEVIAAIEAATGRPVPRRVAPRRAGDPPALYADVARAKSVLGWTATRSDIDTIVKSAWAYHGARWELV